MCPRVLDFVKPQLQVTRPSLSAYWLALRGGRGLADCGAPSPLDNFLFGQELPCYHGKQDPKCL